VWRARKRCCKPFSAFAVLASHHPQGHQPSRQRERKLWIDLQRKVEREAKILALLLEELKVVVAEQPLVEAAFGQPGIVLDVATLHDLILPSRCQLLGGELANRLEHPEAWDTSTVAPPQEVLIQERLEHVCIGAGDQLGRLEAEAPCEDA